MAEATKPRLCDQPVLVIFVLGGLSFLEVGQVQQALEQWDAEQRQSVASSAAACKRVILLSTRMINAEAICHMIFDRKN